MGRVHERMCYSCTNNLFESAYLVMHTWQESVRHVVKHTPVETKEQLN